MGQGGLVGRLRRWATLGLVAWWAALPAWSGPINTPAFSNGTWVGSATYVGELSGPGVSALGDAVINFKLLVSDGEVATGEILIIGEGSSVDEGGGSADLSFTAEGTLGGTASEVTITGSSSWTGTARAQGFEVPIDLDFPFQGSFTLDWATCSQAGGDFSTGAEEAVGAAGLSLDAEGIFLAKKIADEGADDPKTYIPQDYTSLVDDMAAAAIGSVSAADLVKLVQRVEALNAAISAAALCDQVPAGFEEGLVKDDFFYDQLKAIFDKILSSPGDYSTSELLSLLTTAIRVGAVGAAAPDQGFSDSTLLLFEQQLEQRLAAADSQTALDIYVAAKQAGLTELAGKAKAKVGS